MTQLAERLREKYFGAAEHPYKTFEREIATRLAADFTILDAGCGRTAPILGKYVGRARRLIGADLVDFDGTPPGVELLKSDLARIDLPDASVDLVFSRSVMEHLNDPAAVYAEMYRLLKPGGWFILLTPSFWDYASLASFAIPNRLHPYIVRRVEGRAEDDVFPTYYRSNTKRAVRRLAAQTGFELESFRYLGQYPNYFMFNGALFFAATVYEKAIERIPALHALRGWILAVVRKPDR
jgi:SAM-dependent methyltransferase